MYWTRKTQLTLLMTMIFCLPILELQAQEVPRLYKSPRALGMGNAGISIIDDEGAQFYNPANIATGKSRFKKLVVLSPYLEASQEFLNVYQDVSKAGADPAAILKKVQARGYPPYHTYFQNYTGVVFKRTAFGIFMNGQVDARVKLSGFNLQANAGAQSTAGTVLSGAQGFLKDTLLVGVTGKYLYRAAFLQAADLDFVLNKEYQGYKPMDHLAKGSAFGGDFGITYKMIKEDGEPTFSLTVKDIGGTKFSKTLNPNAAQLETIPMTVNFGLSLYPSTRTTKIILGLDYLDITSGHQKHAFKKIHLGAELRFKNIIGARAGFNQGYPAFGGFISAKVFTIEAGVYTEEVGATAGSDPDKRYFLLLSTGY